MRWPIASILLLHGSLHLLGVAKAFGWAELPQLTQPISRALGLLWLVAALLVWGAMAALLAAPRAFWLLGTLAALVSQLAIASAWRDARFGTLANVLLLACAGYAYLTQGPRSFRAAYEGASALARSAAEPNRAVVSAADLAALPGPVQRYLRATGFVGQPRVRSYRLRFRGRIRSAPDARWMPFEADQLSTVEPPSRSFFMRASLYGLPMEALHRLRDGHASMRVKALGALDVVDAQGDVLDRSEAVTLFNDMCILAPGTLLDTRIRWEGSDATSARARFRLGAHDIGATLLFDENGLLRDFVSDDRSRAAPDGKSFEPLRFSTPVRDYRSFGPYRLASMGEARWHLPAGPFTYGEFELLEVHYNAP